MSYWEPSYEKYKICKDLDDATVTKLYKFGYDEPSFLEHEDYLEDSSFRSFEDRDYSVSFYPANKKFYSYGSELAAGGVAFIFTLHAGGFIIVGVLMDFVSLWLFPIALPLIATLFITTYCLMHTNIYEFKNGNRANLRRIEHKYLNLPKSKKKEYAGLLDAIYRHYSSNFSDKMSHASVQKFEKMLDIHQPEKINHFDRIEKIIDEKYQKLEDYKRFLDMAPKE